MAEASQALPARFWSVLDSVLRVPVAPYAEAWLASALSERLLKKKRLSVETDRFGNLHVRYRPPRRRKANLCFQAHLDHPGFRVQDVLSPHRLRLEALGDIPFHCRGAGVRLFAQPGDAGVRGRVLAAKREESGGRVQTVDIQAENAVEVGTLGMWDFPPLRRSGRWLEGRGFDDTLGVALLVDLLEEACRRRINKPFDVLFTRAEEEGFLGAIEMARAGSFSLPPRIVTIEMPRASGETQPGLGVVCRAGDGLGLFSATLVLYLDQRARSLAAADKSFSFQRRLVSTGRTEASVLRLYGYETAALCLAVVNGHNRSKTGAPAPEAVDIHDVLSLRRLLWAAATDPKSPAQTERDAKRTVETTTRPRRARLRRSP